MQRAKERIQKLFPFLVKLREKNFSINLMMKCPTLISYLNSKGDKAPDKDCQSRHSSARWKFQFRTDSLLELVPLPLHLAVLVLCSMYNIQYARQCNVQWTNQIFVTSVWLKPRALCIGSTLLLLSSGGPDATLVINDHISPGRVAKESNWAYRMGPHRISLDCNYFKWCIAQ